LVATSLAPEAINDDWVEPREMTGSDPVSARALWLWTIFGLVLLVAFLAFVVDDFPLRSLIAAR
jgi:hypothetical protein